jgi:lipopolysaccharide cholinephosphotransferase
MNDLQAKQLEIMLTIDQLCRENNIRYYLTGGTAIGAMRHKGFIPWDDDIDIFVTIEEYEKLKVAFVQSNLTNLVLQENYVNGKYWIYSKIRIKGTTQIEREEDKSSTKMQGVFIDIFPIRKCSTSKFKQKKQYIYSQYLTMRAQMEIGWVPKNKKQALIIALNRLMPNKFLFKKAVKCIERSDKLKDNFNYCFFETGRGIKMEKLIFPQSMFAEPIYVQFENVMLPVPTDCHGYLTMFYGDYMTPPPEDKRTQFRHGILIDVEKDYSEYLNNTRGTAVQDRVWVECYPDGSNK